MENRVELCCHTKMSTLQGINSAREYIKTAIDRGDKAIAITDVDSVQSFFDENKYLRLYEKNKFFKIIYGSEMHFKISENTDKLYTIYIYVKKQEGLKNLYELISKAYKNIIDGIPVIYKKDLIEYRSGLLYAAIGNQSEVYQNIEIADIDEIMKFYDFVGIEPNESEKSTNIIINNLCNKNNKLLIGTSECNFINKEDFKCNELLNFYKKNPDIEYGNNKYFYTTDELIKSFDYIENSMEIVIDNTAKIAEQIEKINIIPHKINYPKIESANKIISQKCYVMAKKIYGTTLPEKIKERLELELNSIKNNNFASIYLISSDMVEYSNRLGYGVTNRGSVGDSFVAYLLGITDINPIEYNLPFEFFAGINYDKEPDIDLNFSEIAQAKIFDFLQEKYGKDKIIWGGTIGTSEHLGGVFIIPENIEITDICPVEIGENGFLKTHMDYHSIDNIGLYKFYILRHDVPTMLYALEKETNTSSINIKLDDKETLELFQHVNDISYPISIDGIPEFGTTFVKRMIEIAKPQNINDLFCISALAHGSNTWICNADSLIEKEHKRVDEVISNREDMYNYLLNNGIKRNMAYEIVNFVKSGKASKGQDSRKSNSDRYKKLNEKWTEYKKILQQYNIPEWYIKSAEKIKYMFPKSHVIENSINAFKIAWYKVHYTEAFYKVYAELEANYNLINSKAIGNYCRSIKHKFNTEELAVLVYRNNRMTIEEKIEKYMDLISNYPDMEVIERINCKHYDSVKTMIKEEVQRLNNLYKKLTQDDSDSICVWTEYNKSTLKYEHYNDIKNTFRTYKEAYEDIQNYIEEYDDTISFQITKKYFNENKEIYARYIVENKKIKLINIENSIDMLDIDQIFLNIPTPFKKGDILISKSKSMFNYGDYNEIFVLDYLCTWKEGLEELLAKGNYDSSDMIGYGYYLYGEESTDFVLDHKWDYDSFEYYDGEFIGKDRILKDISSFIKGEISLELFVHAYDYYKNDYQSYLPNFYTDEGLKLAGFSEEDIKKINHRQK